MFIQVYMLSGLISFATDSLRIFLYDIDHDIVKTRLKQ